MANRDELLVLAAQIVSAHVANNTVAPGDVPTLINEVYRALTQTGRVITIAAEPAVPVKRSLGWRAAQLQPYGRVCSMRSAG